MKRTRIAVVVIALLAAAIIVPTVGADRHTRAISTATAETAGPLEAAPSVVAAEAVDTGAVGAWVDGLARAEWYAGVQRQMDADYIAGVQRWLDEQAALRSSRSASTSAPAASVPVASDQGGGGDCDSIHWAAREIYLRESGCRTWAVNGSGCRGIGQACPGSKLPCGDYDFGCQHDWFTGYAMSRYGSWEAAWSAWQSKHWW